MMHKVILTGSLSLEEVLFPNHAAAKRFAQDFVYAEGMGKTTRMASIYSMTPIEGGFTEELLEEVTHDRIHN